LLEEGAYLTHLALFSQLSWLFHSKEFFCRFSLYMEFDNSCKKNVIKSYRREREGGKRVTIAIFIIVGQLDIAQIM
jgi:hypothetical protein